MLIGAAHGRVDVPLQDLPHGVRAVTAPRPGRNPGDGPTVPRDRQRRLKSDQADLLAADPVEAYQPPPGITRRDLVKVLGTGRTKYWATIQSDFGDQAWPLIVELLRCGAVVLRCEVVKPRGCLARL